MVLVIVLAIGFLACCMLIERAMKHAPLRPSEPSSWDARDGVSTCYLRCSLPGTILRRERADLGGQWRHVCPGHSDLGDYEGWWADRDLTHTEQREVHDDARRITGEAAGGERG